MRTPRPMGVETWSHHCSEPRSLALNPGLLPLAWEGCLVCPCCNSLNHPELQGAPQNSSRKCGFWDSELCFPPVVFLCRLYSLHQRLSCSGALWLGYFGKGAPSWDVYMCVSVCVCSGRRVWDIVLTGQEAQNDRKVAREDRERKSLNLTLTG